MFDSLNRDSLKNGSFILSEESILHCVSLFLPFTGAFEFYIHALLSPGVLTMREVNKIILIVLDLTDLGLNPTGS